MKEGESKREREREKLRSHLCLGKVGVTINYRVNGGKKNNAGKQGCHAAKRDFIIELKTG